MKFFAKIFTLLCLLGIGRAQGQECYRLLDSMDRMAERGDFQIESLLQRADSICLLEVTREDSLYGDLLNAHGVFSLNQGKPAEALSFLIRAKAVCLKTRVFYSSNMGSLYSNEGYARTLLGQLQEAVAACDTSLLIKKHLGDTGASLGITLLTRANALIYLGKFAEAKQDLKMSVQNAKDNHIEIDHYQYLSRIVSLGVVHVYLGEWKESIPILEESVQVSIRVFGAENETTIAIMSNLAQAYMAAKNYPLAELNGAKALRLAEKVMPVHPQTNIARQNLGVILLEQGKNFAALSLLLKAKSIEDLHPGLDPVSYATFLSNIGNVYLNLNDYAAALPFFTEAREKMAASVGKESPHYARVNSNLATCHHALGNTALAESLANESFAIVESFGDSFLDYEKLLSNTLVPLEKSEAVLQRMKEVVEIVRRKFGDQSQLFGYYLMNYAAGMGNLGQSKEALPFLEQADHILRNQTKNTASGYYLSALRNLGACHERLGNTKKALAYYQKALTFNRKNFTTDNSFYAFLLVAVADMQTLLGKQRRAFAHYVAADTLYHRFTARNFAILSDAGREAFLADIRPQLDHWHTFAWQNAAAFPEIPGLLFDDQLAEKGRLLHSARSVLASLRGDSTLATQMTQWLAARQLIDFQRTLLAQKDTNARYTIFELDSLDRVADMIETLLTQKSKAFEAATRPVGWRDVQASLAPDEAVVEFFHFNSARAGSATDSILYGALVLRPGDTQPRFIPLFEENQLALLLENEGLNTDEWLGKIYPGRSPKPSELYDLVWQPLEPHIAGLRRVWYAPSGLLHNVALPAISKANGERLLEKYDLQQLGSARELAAAAPLPEEKPQSALILACVSYPTDTFKMRSRTRECLGNPNFIAGRGSGEGNPDPLPNSLPEADTVAVQLQGVGAQVEIRIGYEALEEDTKKSLTDGSSPDVLMFTTHGFASNTLPEAFKGRFPPGNPMYSSGLLLAGAEQVWTDGQAAPGFQDGILTAREIGDLNLQYTRLAILSACESGLGESKSGEGVYGLQRAFKLAGARQVLVTLWKIPDSRETGEFVGQFCHRWLASGDARVALRETQLDFFKRGKKVQVWGGWVLI